jgi:putative flavoprotein involved in K+ transport
MIENNTERFKVIVIGGGQAGLSVGYYLSKSNLSFVILDASKRVGDSWRKRWDSLHLFTPARYNSLPGLAFPAPRHSFPTKDEMGDYLEQYAKHFRLPVRSGIKVDALCREGNFYIVKAADLHLEADQVVIAMSNFQYPKIPSFAKALDPGIVQIHSFNYKNLSQLQEGPVLVVGAGNSGAEIALEAAKEHPVLLSGRDTGHVPFNIEGRMAKLFLISFVLRFIFHRVLTTNTFIGRNARPKAISQGGPLVRIKPKQFSVAGIKRVSRITGVKDGKPVVDNATVLDVKNIVWCTGYYPRFSWIDIPVFKDQEPEQDRGVVLNEPGLYFLGLHFLYAFSSAMIHGVGRDAKYIAKVIKDNCSNSSNILTAQVKDPTDVYSGH